MVLGDVSRTRRTAGNPSTGNVSDADISQFLAYGTAQVIRLTGKTNWETDTLHTDYATAVMAVEYFASSAIRDRFDDQTDISTEHYQRATALARQIADSLSNSATGGTGIATRRYRSYPLNSNAMIYRSMLDTGQELIGIETYSQIPQ
jgi:hypothetical protein